jgi:CRISPR/Cas system CSM-associated protein Csm2 small subunit
MMKKKNILAFVEEFLNFLEKIEIVTEETPLKNTQKKDEVEISPNKIQEAPLKIDFEGFQEKFKSILSTGTKTGTFVDIPGTEYQEKIKEIEKRLSDLENGIKKIEENSCDLCKNFSSVFKSEFWKKIFSQLKNSGSTKEYDYIQRTKILLYEIRRRCKKKDQYEYLFRKDSIFDELIDDIDSEDDRNEKCEAFPVPKILYGISCAIILLSSLKPFFQ